MPDLEIPRYDDMDTNVQWSSAFAAALVAHALLILALTFGLNWRSTTDAPVIFEAELWAELPQEQAAGTPPPAPKPAPKPAPQPEPAPEPEPAQLPEPTPPPPPEPPAPAPEAPPSPETVAAGDIALQKAKEEEQARQEAERQAQLAKEKAERERVAKEKAEQERLAQLKAEQERQAQLAKEKAQRERQERLAREKAQREQLAKERAERERIAKEKADKERQERLAREQAERERVAKEKAQQAEKARQAQLAREKAQRERLAKEKADKERLEAVTRQMRNEQIQRAAGLAGSSSAQGNASVARGPSASYGAKVVAAVKPNIIFTGRLNNNPAATVEVKTAANGEIIGRRLVRSSGVEAWDQAVLRAVDRTNFLPLDENGSVPSPMQIKFRPND